MKSRKPVIYLKYFVLILLLLRFSDAAAGQPTAVSGILDLRNEKIDTRYHINLKGEWEFYYEKMLFPNDFRNNLTLKPYYGIVPSYWTDYSPDGDKLPGKGYGTYRLIILLPEGTRNRFGLGVPVFDSSYDLWLNGNLLCSNGIPGKSKETTSPYYKPEFRVFSSETDTIEIIINVANFHHRRGGFWLPLKFGGFSPVQKASASKWALSYASVIMLLGFGLFFLIFYILYPKDTRMAFFTLALIGLAIRPLFTGEFLVNDLGEFSWNFIVRMEYISLFMILGGWIWFIRMHYPSKAIRYYSSVITIYLVISAAVTLFLTPDQFSITVIPYYAFAILLITYTIYMSLRGMVKGRIVDSIYFIAFSFLTIAAINDMAVSMGMSGGTGYIMSYVVMGFVFLQSVLLLYNWIETLYVKERLQAELEYMNKNLELLISQRTQELTVRNEEIGKQNQMIAEQNRQLSDTIQLKNKVFSVISHDLRSPVVNILYLLNLLKEEEYKEKYDTFANSSIEYAQLVINLLENMLVWGRGQEDKIKYSPAFQDLSSIVLTNMSIFKEGADRKDISVNFTQKGNSLAWFDKDLIDIVIRNLLSNALKYTRRGGRISILVKDESSDDNRMIIKICDNGIGIPPERAAKLFSSEEIDTTPGTENEKGTGLGLKLCSELIKINKGKISVDSKAGEGTCFIIELPANGK